MDKLDRLFEIVFARCRRECNDSNVKLSWRQAWFKVSGHICWAVMSVVVLLYMGTHFLIKNIGSPIERKWGFVIVSFLVGLKISALLHRRFKKYQTFPPVLPAEEAHADKWFVFWFRTISFSMFVLVCLIGYLLGGAGISFR
jgi:hypothetical protein